MMFVAKLVKSCFLSIMSPRKTTLYFFSNGHFSTCHSPTIDNLPEIKQTKTDLSINVIFDLLN